MRDVRQRSFFALDQNTRFSSVFLLRHELVEVYKRLSIARRIFVLFLRLLLLLLYYYVAT